MQDTYKIVAQDAFRINAQNGALIAKHRLRGIGSFLFFLNQDGDPQCKANEVPFEARILTLVSHRTVDLTMRQIENHLPRMQFPRAEIAIRALNEACAKVVLDAVKARRQHGFRVFEPQAKWLLSTH
jgi:hypothetical protein